MGSSKVVRHVREKLRCSRISAWGANSNTVFFARIISGLVIIDQGCKLVHPSLLLYDTIALTMSPIMIE